MAKVLYSDPWVTVTLDEARALVRYDRTDVAYPSGADMERSYAAVGRAFNLLPPSSRLLLDMRRAPPRNDDAFEAKARPALEQVLKRFTRNATLVRTAVGKLQSMRIASERGAKPHVFDDEQAALAYLMASTGSPTT